MVVAEVLVVILVQKWLLEILTVVVEVEPEILALEELEDLKEMLVEMHQVVQLMVRLVVVVLAVVVLVVVLVFHLQMPVLVLVLPLGYVSSCTPWLESRGWEPRRR